MSDLDSKIQHVVSAVRNLAQASVSDSVTSSSIGTYYEERELAEALKELLGGRHE